MRYAAEGILGFLHFAATALDKGIELIALPFSSVNSFTLHAPFKQAIHTGHQISTSCARFCWRIQPDLLGLISLTWNRRCLRNAL